MFNKFIKDLRAISKSTDATDMPHPDSFYADLFSIAYQLIAKRSEQDQTMYRKLLANDTIKFFALTLKTNEEKHSKTKYVGQIDFDSQLLDGGIPMNIAPKQAAPKKAEPTEEKEEKKEPAKKA